MVPARMQRIEFLSSPREFDTPFEFTHERQIVPDVGERLGVIGVQCQSQLRLRLELLILTAEKMYDREPTSRIRVSRVKLGSSQRMRQRAADRIRPRVHLKTVLGQINIGE